MFLALAIVFLALGVIALLLGARRIASCTFAIAKVLFIINVWEKQVLPLGSPVIKSAAAEKAEGEKAK